MVFETGTSKKTPAASSRPRIRRSAKVAASADSDLIRSCREFEALERRILAATLNIDNAAGRDRVTTPLYRRQDMLLDTICGAAPQTLGGCKAVASTLDLWTRCLGQTGIDRSLLEVLLAGLAALKA